jgi:hypothetical protein
MDPFGFDHRVGVKFLIAKGCGYRTGSHARIFLTLKFSKFFRVARMGEAAGDKGVKIRIGSGVAIGGGRHAELRTLQVFFLV